MTTRNRTVLSVLVVTLGLIGSAGAQAKPFKIKEEQAGLLGQAKISARDAQATAQAKFPAAAVVSGEIEREDGKLIYSFDLQQPGVKGIEEVNVDAMTGAVLATEHENPADEAKEKAKLKVSVKKPPPR
jgi:hypothetical protein